MTDLVERLKEALRPFAQEGEQYAFHTDCPPCVENGDGWGDDEWLADVPTEFTCGDLRRARDLIRELDGA